MDPVIYPSITIGGQPYLLRFGFNAVHKLASWKLDIRKMLADLSLTDMGAPENIHNFTAMAAACLGREVGKDREWESAEWVTSVQKFADRILEGEFAPLPAAVNEALVKAIPVGTSAPTLPGTSETATGQILTQPN